MAMATPGNERRLAAILAADIVGYSRLIEEDEAATRSAICAAGWSTRCWPGIEDVSSS